MRVIRIHNLDLKNFPKSSTYHHFDLVVYRSKFQIWKCYQLAAWAANLLQLPDRILVAPCCMRSRDALLRAMPPSSMRSCNHISYVITWRPASPMTSGMWSDWSRDVLKYHSKQTQSSWVSSNHSRGPCPPRRMRSCYHMTYQMRVYIGDTVISFLPLVEERVPIL